MTNTDEPAELLELAEDARPERGALSVRVVGDVHRRLELALVREQRRDLRQAVPGDILDVVGLFRLEEQHGVRAVRRHVVLGEEVRISRRDHRVAGEKPGGAVIRVKTPSTPWVVREHHVGPQHPDPVRNLSRQRAGHVELAVDDAEVHDVALRARARRPRRAARRTRVSISSVWSAVGSHDPFEPSVQIRWLTTHPAADHLANVAPQLNSTSSGWAAMASARGGRREVESHQRSTGAWDGSSTRSAGTSTSQDSA